jgi:hypothetical protein
VAVVVVIKQMAVQQRQLAKMAVQAVEQVLISPAVTG